MRKLSMIIILIFVTVLLSGCWSRKELNDLAIVTALAVDKAEEGYLVTAQIINPGEIAGKTQTTRVAVSTYRTTGRSVFEAIRKLTTEAPRKLYLAHIRMVIFGEELAKEGITKVLDFLSRDHEIRTDFYIAVAKGGMGTSLLNVLTPIDKIPASKMFNSITHSQKSWAPTSGVHLDNLISRIISEGNNPVLTGIYYSGTTEMGNRLENVERVDTPTTIKLDHLAIFKKGKLVGWLNKNESKGYNYITDHVDSTVGVAPCKGGNITLEVTRSKTDVKAKVENGIPKITIKKESEANIGEVQCELDIMDENKIKELEIDFKNKAKKMMLQVIEKAREHKTDIFGFGEAVHRADPEIWNKLKKDWHVQGFNDIQVSFDIKFNIRRTGTITKPFQKKGE